ncbi:MAG: efflux RND transporter permease subunit, partial [Chloroflexota bacterium]|nr:efflux RND transporter permease subunit [Chloroflexota bacterium]
MTWLTDWSLKRGSVTLLVAIGLVFGGLYSAVSINQELIADLDFPILTIVTANPGGNPEDVANTVTAPIEAVLSGTPKMKSLQSVSAESVSIVIAQFDFGDDMREAEAEVLRRVAGVSLPAAASTP